MGKVQNDMISAKKELKEIIGNKNAENMSECIRLEKNLSFHRSKLSNITTTMIGEISRFLPAISSETLGKEVYEMFESSVEIQGLPVIEEDKPVGLIMKHNFFKNLGQQYGYVIYIKRSIDRIMDKQPLIVDYQTPLDRVSELAMQRDKDSLYDYIIVTQKGKYHGIVTVKDLLQKTTEIQLNRAKFSNPLTGLPGNILIEKEITNVITKHAPYAVLYFDLDNFKPYNDVYGFDNGDKVIEMTAEVIEQRMQALGYGDEFLGHVGGDDFVAVIQDAHVEKLCEAIIEKFDRRILEYYTELDRKNGFIFAENRHGVVEKFPIMSISIAVINNKHHAFDTVGELAEAAGRVKKKCKASWCSNYIIE
ncbi:MAG: GGDEF domain-containing protein [Bacillota bacterium]